MQTGERLWAKPAVRDGDPSIAASHSLFSALKSESNFLIDTADHNAYFRPDSESQMIIAGMDLIVPSQQSCNGISWGKQMRLTGPEWT